MLGAATRMSEHVPGRFWPELSFVCWAPGGVYVQGNLATICRSSQPIVGVKLSYDHEADQQLLQHIHAASGKPDAPATRE
jgi:hypothetical protein